MYRIAYIIGELTHGGAEKQLFELVKGLDKKQFSPIVICLSEDKEPYGPLIEALKIPVYYLKRKTSYEIKRILCLAILLKKIEIDVVHTFLHIGNGYGVIASIFSDVRNFIPSIRSEEKNRHFFMKITDWLAIKYAKVVVTNSKRGKEFVLSQWKLDERKIKVIHNGVHLNKYYTNSNYKYKNKYISITIIGKPTYAKNITMVFKVAEYVIKEYPYIEFNIIGPGLSEEKYYIPNNLKNYIHLLGPKRDISKILNKSNIYISTSISEGLPNTIMEAMSAGKPVIATDVGGVSELVIDGETGYLTPSNNAEFMAKRIVDLINNPKKQIAFGTKGRKVMEINFSVKKMVKKTENLYLSILKQ